MRYLDIATTVSVISSYYSQCNIEKKRTIFLELEWNSWNSIFLARIYILFQKEYIITCVSNVNRVSIDYEIITINI